jgi:hypothetical protein
MRVGESQLVVHGDRGGGGGQGSAKCPWWERVCPQWGEGLGNEYIAGGDLATFANIRTVRGGAGTGTKGTTADRDIRVGTAYKLATPLFNTQHICKYLKPLALLHSGLEQYSAIHLYGSRKKII